MSLVLRAARPWGSGARSADIVVAGGRVAASTSRGAGRLREVDLAGRTVLPGLVNAHDHLDFSTFPFLGRPPYPSLYAWAEDVGAGASDPRVRQALSVPTADRLFLGGLRNLLAGATAVLHHGPFHRALGRAAFPVRVQDRYDFAHSPGLTPDLRRAYRTTDRRIPWLVHAAEGTDERCRAEVEDLRRANVLRHNTVIIHGIAIPPEEMKALSDASASVVWCPESNRRLFAATADVAGLRAAGVRVGLGSDAPVSGVRDPLSNLASARGERVLSDDDLLAMATLGSAEVARLPPGGFSPGAAADLVAVSSLDGFLEGDRRAVELVLVGGEACYGLPELMEAAGARPWPLSVLGRRRALGAGLGRRLCALCARFPFLKELAWTRDLAFD